MKTCSVDGLYKTSYAELKAVYDNYIKHNKIKKKEQFINVHAGGGRFGGIAVYHSTAMKTLPDLVRYFHEAWGI